MSRRVAVAFGPLVALALIGCGQPGVPAVSESALPVAPVPIVLPEPPPDPGPPDLRPFRDVDVVVPDWGPGAGSCPTGRMSLGRGQHVPSTGRVINLMSYVRSDVDADAVDDYVVHLMCGEGPESPGWQVVAFRSTGTELRAIGRVIGSQDGLAMMSGLSAVPNGRIAVNVSNRYTDSGPQFVPHQWRTYAWRNGHFRQVDGPTSFPANAPAARLSVDPAGLLLRAAQGGWYVGELTATARNEGDAAVANAVLTLILPREVRPAGGAWRGCTMLPPETSYRSIRIDCPIGPLGPRASSSITFQLVASERPRVLGSSQSGVYERSHHYLVVNQLPPYTFQDPQITEADVRISLGESSQTT